MKNKLHILSMALLGLYSLVLLHNMVPHLHFDELGRNAEKIGEVHNDHHKGHHHHHHKNHKTSSSQHIEHENHFDHGLFDYVVCFFSESDHPAADIRHCNYISVKTSERSAYWIAKAKFAAVLISVFTEWSDEEFAITFGPEVVSSYLSPPLLNSPHRGPPAFVA